MKNLFLGVELRDGGDLEGLERKSFTFEELSRWNNLQKDQKLPGLSRQKTYWRQGHEEEEVAHGGGLYI